MRDPPVAVGLLRLGDSHLVILAKNEAIHKRLQSLNHFSAHGIAATLHEKRVKDFAEEGTLSKRGARIDISRKAAACRCVKRHRLYVG